MNRRTPNRDVEIFGVRLDLELLGIHLVVTCLAVYAAADLGVSAWRGVVAGLVAYLVTLLRHPGDRSAAQ
ncbi:hypothetical protein [Halorussus ruber]|uniref:hypothetical protein n=1 Tax=Halorussus ruber TaxID=1126238 RepID=UPI001092C222|nr:hypothetical protein [Halorussus ruber]